ncbi:MAG TPA: putative baseplate assembly protein, partial [Thermoanaerobaculia bacterium]
TGSWTEVLVAVDPLSAEEDDGGLLWEIRGVLHRYRRIGHDVVVKRAVSVPLDLALIVCVRPHFLRGHVEAALREVFGNRVLADGRRGFFHPDNLTFGQGIALSRLLAAAQAVAGVASVEVTKLERLYEGPNGEIAAGFLPIGPLEIARVDNDPRFPGNGQLRLTMGGGR